MGRPIALFPITLRRLIYLFRRFGYAMVCNDGTVVQFEQDGQLPEGFTEIPANWERVITCLPPDFSAEGYDDPVYDRSDVITMLVEATGEDRTETGVRIKAILQEEKQETSTECVTPEPVSPSSRV